MMPVLSRRHLLGGASALGLAAVSGALSGCGSKVSISSNPNELVLWYWTRSINPDLLANAAKGIPGSPGRFVRGDIIGGTFDTKLRTSLAGKAYIPDISAINSNASLYFPNENLFTDLNKFGAASHKGEYYDWKWSLGTTPTGRFCFWPMDTGPTGFYYRQDIFAKAGLPSDHAQLSTAIQTWNGFIDVGKRLRAKVNSAMIINAQTIFDRFIDASPERYFDKNNKPLFDQPGSAIKKAWNTAVQAIRAGITANLQTTTDQNAGWANGRVAGNVSAVWWAQTLQVTAPATKGKWRIASQPVRAGNYGGSFLSVPTSCKDPQAAFDFIRWLTSPDNQAKSFNAIKLFPSTLASFTSGIMKSEGDFFGSQSVLAFFSKAAEQVPTSFVSTYESQVTAFDTEITNVEAAGKDPDRAWRDAVDQTNRLLSKRGVL